MEISNPVNDMLNIIIIIINILVSFRGILKDGGNFVD